MRAVYQRELSSYFQTPLGYIFVGVFLAISSLIFGLNNLSALSSDLSGFFSMMSYVWMLLTPVLVMRLIAGERKSMTDQLLFTAPVRIGEIVLGKYLAACTVLLLSVLLSLIYVVLVALQGKVYLGELMTLYIGFTLQGCAFIAFDLMISSLAKSPTTATVLAFGGNLFLWLATIASSGATAMAVKRINGFFNLYDRLIPFLYGQLSYANILFFLLFSGVCIYASVQIVGARRWSEL